MNPTPFDPTPHNALAGAVEMYRKMLDDAARSFALQSQQLTEARQQLASALKTGDDLRDRIIAGTAENARLIAELRETSQDLISATKKERAK